MRWKKEKKNFELKSKSLTINLFTSSPAIWAREEVKRWEIYVNKKEIKY